MEFMNFPPQSDESMRSSKRRLFVRLKAVIVTLIVIALGCGFLSAGYRNYARIRHVRELAATSTVRAETATVTDKQQVVSGQGRLILSLSLNIRGKITVTHTSDLQKWDLVKIGDTLPVTVHIASDGTVFLEDWQPAVGWGQRTPP